MKNNDYYYKVRLYPDSDKLSDWLSWSEVCSLRRQGEYETIEKVTIIEYIKQHLNEEAEE